MDKPAQEIGNQRNQCRTHNPKYEPLFPLGFPVQVFFKPIKIKAVDKGQHRDVQKHCRPVLPFGKNRSVKTRENKVHREDGHADDDNAPNYCPQSFHFLPGYFDLKLRNKNRMEGFGLKINLTELGYFGDEWEVADYYCQLPTHFSARFPKPFCWI
jgi:hypothetical protein